MADERIEVEIVLDDGSIVKGFQKINDKADDSAKKVGNAFSRGLRRGFNTKAIGRGLSKVRSQVFNFRNAILGAFAIIGGGALVKEFVEAASIQQDAVNQLNTSLRTAGSFSEEASKSFQDFASSLQATSTFGDEVILQQAALARNFTKSNDEAQKLTKAAVELSAAAGISLDSAITNLGKTFAGLAGEIGESVPAIRNLTAEQLKAGAALDLVIERFGGSALAQTRTFSGSLQQLKNTVGDLFEGFGSLITNSPVVIALFNSLTTVFNNLTKSFSGSGANLDIFIKNLVLGVASGVNAVIDTFETLSQIPSFIRFVFKKVQIETSEFVQKWLVIIQPLAAVLDVISFNTGASARQIKKNFQRIFQLKDELAALGQASIKGGEGFNFARKTLDDFITTFQELSLTTSVGQDGSILSGTVDAVALDIDKIKASILDLQDRGRVIIREAFRPDLLEGTDTVFENLAGKSKSALEKIKQELTAFVTDADAKLKQFNDAVQNGFARAVSAGIQSFVNALIKGENALVAFGKAFIGVLGDVAIQLGTTILIGGLGLQNLFAGNPAGAIVFGASLIAIGTLLKALSGGGFAGAAAGGAPPGQDATTAPLLDNGDLREPSAAVQVTIEGNVFDSEDTGLRIADILKDQGFNNAVVS